MRLALDTNVLVAAFATRGLCADLLRAILARHELLFLPAVRRELDGALAKKIRLPEAERRRILGFLDEQGAVACEAPLQIAELAWLTDRGDRQVVAEAVAAGAEAMVTGDGELLAASGRLPLPVLSPRELWERLRRAGS